MSNLVNLATPEKKRPGLERLSRFDAVALVTNMALEVREAELSIRYATAFDGNLRLVSSEAAEEVAAPERIS